MNSTVPAFPRLRGRSLFVAGTGLVLAMGVSSLPIGEWDREFLDLRHLIGNEAIWWIYVAAMLMYVRLIERRPLQSIGVRSTSAGGVGLGMAAGVVITVTLWVLYAWGLPALHLSDGIAATANAKALAATPLWWRLASAARAAVAEEILFRGYAFSRIEELSRSRTVALVVTCAVFTLAHVQSWGWSHEIIVATAGVALTLLFMWRRNIWINMVAHFIIDAASVIA